MCVRNIASFGNCGIPRTSHFNEHKREDFKQRERDREASLANDHRREDFKERRQLREQIVNGT